MTSMRRRAVFDCNVFLQAMLNTHGAAHACWQCAVAGEVELMVTPYILGEIRSLPFHKRLRRLSRFTPARVDRFVDQLRDVGRVVADPPPSFKYSRDPDDAHYVDLAISSGAMLVVTNDKDLLDLMTDLSAEGILLRTTYPLYRTMNPPQFLSLIRESDP